MELKVVDVECMGDKLSDMKDGCHMAAEAKFVSKFDKLNVKQYLLTFETAKQIHNYLEEKWIKLLHM